MGSYFLAKLIFEKWAVAIFIWVFESFGTLETIFGQFVAKKSGQKPGFVLKVATLKPLQLLGFRGLWPKTHFYLLLIVIKNIINIYNRANKTGLLTKGIFYAIFTRSFMKGR